MKKLIPFGVPIVFFLVSFLTLNHYGISWDEPIHFQRGQAYLRLFLTGEKDYLTFSGIRSFYQNDSLNGVYFLEKDSGHPPFNGMLASLFNYIFYQKLYILGDIESYHFFNIFISFILVLVVSIFAYQLYGPLTSIVAGLVISSYPLFFSEAHFNIKDPSEASFFALTIWTFWLSTKKGSWKWLAFSILSFTMGLSTKFNILFLPLIVIPYLVIRFKKSIFNQKYSELVMKISKLPKFYLTLLMLSPLTIISLFFLWWPFLWHNSLTNFLQITKYYQDIGLDQAHRNGYYIWGNINLFPLFWILLTTPALFIILTIFGIYGCFKYNDQYKTSYLWLFWLVIPILRVTIPNTSIYGGIRQIMEYIPALALIAGLGAYTILQLLKNPILKTIAVIIITGAFIGHFITLTKLHPNENVYYNFLLGGLSKAYQYQIPYAGNSFGNAYWQAVQWLNNNAENNAKLALIEGTSSNVPSIQVRTDIQYSNAHWSGINRQGEYLLELTYNNPVMVYQYAWNYINRFLEPVYQVKVDGVPIAKVWKNDLEHTKPEMRLKEIPYQGKISLIQDRKKINIVLDSQVSLSRLILNFQKDQYCKTVKAEVFYSPDEINWIQSAEPIPFSQLSGSNLKETQVNYYFAGEKVKMLQLVADNINSCIFNDPEAKAIVLE